MIYSRSSRYPTVDLVPAVRTCCAGSVTPSTAPARYHELDHTDLSRNVWIIARGLVRSVRRVQTLTALKRGSALKDTALKWDPRY